MARAHLAALRAAEHIARRPGCSREQIAQGAGLGRTELSLALSALKHEGWIKANAAGGFIIAGTLALAKWEAA